MDSNRLEQVAGPVLSHSYAYDGTGNTGSEQAVAGGWSLSYDNAGRLTSTWLNGVCAAMLIAMPGAGAGLPVVSSHRAINDFYLGGIWAGEMAVEAAFNKGVDGSGNYRARINARTAGFRPGLMGAKARRPFALFYQQRGDGLFHVVRVVGQTSFGLAVLLLRE